MKKLTILGSTGSIGESTLKIVDNLNPEFKVVALAAHKNIDKLEQQIKKYHPEIVAVYDSQKAQELKKRVPNQKIVVGMEGLEEVAAYPASDIVMSAMVGTVGLQPTIAAIKAGKKICLANKEPLVSAGELVTSLAKKMGAQIIPVDSEHSAIFQCQHGERKQDIKRLILTASGGPFRTFHEEQLKNIKPEDALKHPNWNMGPKITVDCSTLMNKGLEVIETHWLFDTPYDKIEVVIHPQSIIHSLVEFVDGSMLAQMSVPTMLVPIQYSLTYPERRPGLIKPFDFIQNNTLQFQVPDLMKFRCLRLAFDAIKEGGSMPCYMNGANEVLVNRFLSGQIGWTEIGERLEKLMQRHKVGDVHTIENILEVDKTARHEAQAI